MKLGFGGGCHWCTEGVFVSLKGVQRVEQGWIASTAPHDRESEAVIVHFDLDVISLSEMVEAHVLTHASSSDHSMRSKYRSAVYTFSAQQRAEVAAVIAAFEEQNQRTLITKVLPFVSFRLNKEEYLDYFRKNPENAFCQRYIQPKIELLKTKHSALLG